MKLHENQMLKCDGSLCSLLLFVVIIEERKTVHSNRYDYCVDSLYCRLWIYAIEKS